MKNVFKYLRDNYSSEPNDVDRLFVSAYCRKNEITVQHNTFIKNYIIDDANTKERDLLANFIGILEKESKNFDFETLIELFEFVISPADRIVNGAVYTPNNIREFIIQQAFTNFGANLNNAKIGDIACGCGGFLFSAAQKLRAETNRLYAEIFEQNIYGLDIQPYSVDRTKILLSLLALSEGEDVEHFNFNLFVGDALAFDWMEKVQGFTGFQAVVGNPPYVRLRNLDLVTKTNLARWEVARSGLTDLYIPFFQIGIENLAENGVLGFITMNSFFKSLNGRALRAYFQEKRLSFRIIDFGATQVFESRNTYTCICLIQKIQREFIEYTREDGTNFNAPNNAYTRINYAGLNAQRGWNLHDHDAISRIEATGVPFSNLYTTRHGIATLKNDIYIFRPVAENEDYYFLQNGRQFQIEKGICKDIVNSNKLSSEQNLGKLKEKVIFPYDNTGDSAIIFEEEFIREEYPHAYEYLRYKKEILAERDKGKAAEYRHWYAFGRTQSLERMEHKLFFPKYSHQTPKFILDSDDTLLFYNGLAVIGESREELMLAQKIMESSVFWYYIKSTSKPYSADYYSLNGTYINNFGVYQLDDGEREFVLNETNQTLLNDFFEEKYRIRG